MVSFKEDKGRDRQGLGQGSENPRVLVGIDVHRVIYLVDDRYQV